MFKYLHVSLIGIVFSFAVPSYAFNIDWVTVGDPGNTADTTGSPNPAGTVAD
jgi:hypothetical protein